MNALHQWTKQVRCSSLSASTCQQYQCWIWTLIALTWILLLPLLLLLLLLTTTTATATTTIATTASTTTTTYGGNKSRNMGMLGNLKFVGKMSWEIHQKSENVREASEKSCRGILQCPESGYCWLLLGQCSAIHCSVSSNSIPDLYCTSVWTAAVVLYVLVAGLWRQIKRQVLRLYLWNWWAECRCLCRRWTSCSAVEQHLPRGQLSHWDLALYLYRLWNWVCPRN